MTQGLTEDFTDQRWYNWRTPALLSSFQSPNRVQLFVTPWTATCQASLSITNSQRLPKLTSVESVMPSNHLNLCRPLLRLPSIFPSTSVFSNESVLHIRWPKYWSFSFSMSPSKEWLVGSPCSSADSQESSPAPRLERISFQCSAIFIVQVLDPYMTTGKNMILTIWTFVGKVMSLLFIWYAV